MEYSFSATPDFDLGFKPLGLPAGALTIPGLTAAIRWRLLKLVTRRLVEPQRRTLDVRRLYLVRSCRLLLVFWNKAAVHACFEKG